MILETVNVGPMQVNCYILACAEEKSAIIIDPGDEANRVDGSANLWDTSKV